MTNEQGAKPELGPLSQVKMAAMSLTRLHFQHLTFILSLQLVLDGPRAVRASA